MTKSGELTGAGMWPLQAVMVASMCAMIFAHENAWIWLADIAVSVVVIALLTASPQRAGRYRHCLLDFSAMTVLMLLMPTVMVHGSMASTPAPGLRGGFGHAHLAGAPGSGGRAVMIAVFGAWIIGHAVLWRLGGARRTTRTAGSAVMMVASVLMLAAGG
ncbi:hypothetical protein [Speluncibacter jeojiensis]|uniref:Uncharacterized protein n=1 Tax=Speluncibacter jeojiensis TaxID=2710754 RepID=A0A9X4RFW9_9ACTN|nr:hypothetical protein [Corynebacteriales bacterium D3-21]